MFCQNVFIISTLFLFWGNIWAQADSVTNGSSSIREIKETKEVELWTQNRFRFGLDTRVRVPWDFFSQISLQPHLEMFLENYFDHAIYQLPAMGGYSYPDNYVFSLLGNSWLWNRYSYRGHALNDPFFDGTMLHRMPMFSRILDIDTIAGQLTFYNHYEKQFYGRVTTGYLGSNIPYYKFLFDTYTQQSPQLRDRPPTESRRRNRFTVDLFSKDYLQYDGNRLWLNTYARVQDRVINDFDINGNANPFTETFFQLSFNGEWERKDGSRPWGWMATYTTRDQWMSEFYFRRKETSLIHDFALSGYYNEEDKFSHRHIVHFNYKGINRHYPNFSRNLYDLTGEGLDPFFPSGDIFSISQHSYLGYGFDVVKKDFLTVETKLSHTVNIFSPHQSSYSNPVYFQSPDDFLSLYVTKWHSSPLAYVLLNYTFDLSINQVEEEGFKPYVEFGASLSGIGMNKESLLKVRPYFSSGIQILNGVYAGSHQQLRIEVGRINVPFNNKLALFISDLYNNGKNYVWNDEDQDSILDSGEETSDLHSTTGGIYREVDKNLNQPHYYYLDIPYNVDFNNVWSFSIAAHYRIFKDQLWVKLNDVKSSGSYMTTNGVRVYVSSLGKKHYTVYNLPSSKFPSSPNWFNDSPFYMGMAAKITAVGDWYFFSLSFGAYLVNGITTLGNGPLHNSQGTLSELMGDPNTDYRNLGRLDSDRAYVGKLLLAFRFLPAFIGVMDFKYRDGQPIGQWNYYVHGDKKQVSFIRNSVSADNILLYNGEFGTREDSIMSLDLRFQYTWKMKSSKIQESGEILEFGLNIYNLIDIARELAEFSFFSSGSKITSDRYALELQVPRGIEFSVRYRY